MGNSINLDIRCVDALYENAEFEGSIELFVECVNNAEVVKVLANGIEVYIVSPYILDFVHNSNKKNFQVLPK